MSKLNILFINNDYRHFCGASLSLLDLFESLKDKITPIILLGEDGPVNVNLKKLGYETIICPFLKLYAPSETFSYLYHLPSLTWQYYHVDKHCIDYVADLLESRNIDLIHSNSSIFTVGYFLSKRMGIPHVWHVREFLDFAPYILLGRKRLRRLFSKTDAVIYISNALKTYWSRNDKNAFVVGDAVRKREDAIFIKDKEKYILSCSAQLSDYKGSNFIAEAFAESMVYEKGYSLYMTGEYTSDYKEKIQNIFKERGVPLSHLRLLGYRNDVKDLFTKATAFVMASKNEGLGRVSIESMFYGCPVIARNVGGTSDFIVDKKTGLIYQSLEECSKLISQVVYNDMSTMVINAQNYIVSNYSTEEYGGKIMKVYEFALANSRNG